MQVNMDLWDVRLTELTSDQLRLIDRLRAKLRSEDIRSKIWRSYDGYRTYLVEALIAKDPETGKIKLDFRTYHPPSIGQAFTGPQVLLDDDIFQEAKFRELLFEVRSGIDEFMIRLRST